MATGDIKWFSQALLDLGNKIHDMDGEDLRLGLVDSTTTPSLSTAAPHWGGTGTTNFATNQVATGTSYTGPIALTTKTWSLVSNVPTLRADVVTVATDASGFTNARWGILYNNTDANKRAIAFVDLGSARSIASQPLQFDWNGASNDVLTITQS